MEADLQAQSSPVAESIDATADLSGESASPSSQEIATPGEAFDMDAFIRGRAFGASDPTSNPDGVVPTAEMEADRDGEPAPTGDVKPSDQPGQRGRRGSAARIAELEAENARLKQAYDAANPPPPDASEETRKAILAREQRFRDLNGRASDDPTLYQQGPDGKVNADWLDEEKKRRSIAPELRQHYETVLTEDLRSHQEAFEGQTRGFQTYVLQGMEAVKDLPGVDFDAIKAAPDFVARERLIYQAGANASAAEATRLRNENQQLRRELGGAIPKTLNGGQSPPAAAGFDMNSWIRQRSGVA